MPRGSSQLRLFIAAYPPAEAVARMMAPLRAISLPKHRETPLEQVHLTILFIGPRPAKELDQITESVERAASGLDAFDLTPQSLTTLPKRGDARLIALETDAPATLIEIHRRLVTRLANDPRRHPSDRFLPHFTLLRFKPPVRFRLGEIEADAPPFRIDRICLMRSILRAEGAEHATVAEVPLGERAPRP